MIAVTKCYQNASPALIDTSKFVYKYLVYSFQKLYGKLSKYYTN